MPQGIMSALGSNFYCCTAIVKDLTLVSDLPVTLIKKPP